MRGWYKLYKKRIGIKGADKSLAIVVRHARPFVAVTLQSGKNIAHINVSQYSPDLVGQSVPINVLVIKQLHPFAMQLEIIGDEFIGQAAVQSLIVMYGVQAKIFTCWTSIKNFTLN